MEVEEYWDGVSRKVILRLHTLPFCHRGCIMEGDMQWSDVAKTCILGGFEAGEGLQVEWTWTRASLDNSFLPQSFTAQHSKFHANNNGTPSLSPCGLHLCYESISTMPGGNEPCQGQRKHCTLCREAQALGPNKSLNADHESGQQQSMPPFELAVGFKYHPCQDA